MERLEPIDIFNKDFKEVLRGYSKKEVNEFLDLVIKNYEDVLQENEQYREDMVRLKRELKAAQKEAIRYASSAAPGSSPEVELSLSTSQNHGAIRKKPQDLKVQHAHSDEGALAKILNRIDQFTQRLEDLENHVDQLRQQKQSVRR